MNPIKILQITSVNCPPDLFLFIIINNKIFKCLQDFDNFLFDLKRIKNTMVEFLFKIDISKNIILIIHIVILSFLLFGS